MKIEHQHAIKVVSNRVASYDTYEKELKVHKKQT